MHKPADYEEIFPRPLSGHYVSLPLPTLLPSRLELVGREVVLEPQNAQLHSEQLYNAGHESPEALAIWDYLPMGHGLMWMPIKHYCALNLPVQTPCSSPSA